MKKLEKIVFFGSGPVAAASVRELSKQFQIECVITKSKKSNKRYSAPVEEFAQKSSYNLVFADSKNELNNIFKNSNIESRVGVVVDYGVIIPKNVIDYFPLKIVNSHFSLLPMWRGADPITYSILSGQETTGVSLMIIDESLDTGKLIGSDILPVGPNDTAADLTEKLVKLSNKLLRTQLPKYLDGQIKPVSQPHPDRATYSQKILKDDGKVDLNKTAKQLEREVRAFLNWPGSFLVLNGQTIIITRAHVSNAQLSPLDLKCVDGLYLSIDELKVPGKSAMSAKSFLNGYGVKLFNKTD